MLDGHLHFLPGYPGVQSGCRSPGDIFLGWWACRKAGGAAGAGRAGRCPSAAPGVPGAGLHPSCRASSPRPSSLLMLWLLFLGPNPSYEGLTPPSLGVLFHQNFPPQSSHLERLRVTYGGPQTGSLTFSQVEQRLKTKARTWRRLHSIWTRTADPVAPPPRHSGEGKH